MNLSFGQLYMMGVYSRTLPLLIKALVSFLPITIPGFFIINFGISVVILICAMQKMKEDRLQRPLEFTTESNTVNKPTDNAGNFSGYTSTFSDMNTTDRSGNDFSWMK